MGNAMKSNTTLTKAMECSACSLDNWLGFDRKTEQRPEAASPLLCCSIHVPARLGLLVLTKPSLPDNTGTRPIEQVLRNGGQSD
jgi:hypothetical protein